ncbi:unnamed protein product [Soboliphyme baturini]|uniref:Palmitoyltransferase n=1 Tax=Soboliphyme baturini TaxID=241478 RepID=A0A183IU35_9BILA|nr:unnamed protein product [Soboliphyme baturini]
MSLLWAPALLRWCVQSDVPGVTYTLCSLTLVLVTNVHFACPAVYGTDHCTGTLVFGYLCVLQALVNFVLFRYRARYNRSSWYLSDRLRENTSATAMITRHTVTDDDQQPEQEHCGDEHSDGTPTTGRFLKFCHLCNAKVLARCHHCPLCRYCVLRKDHHCFFLGACVGFGNQRNFVVFLFWVLLGAAYGTFLTLK